MDQILPAHPKFLRPSIELIPRSYLAPLDLRETFGREAPLQVDLGCGDGSFLAVLAAMQPAHDFLGIERLVGRVRLACHKARDLPNARVLRIETAYAVRYLLPPASVSVFHFLFPDPWPKRRHHRRRVFNHEFLEALVAALIPAGRLRIATDQGDYFAQMTELIRARGDLTILPGNEKLPPTTFEKRFQRSGDRIYRVELLKTSPVI